MTTPSGALAQQVTDAPRMQILAHNQVKVNDDTDRLAGPDVRRHRQRMGPVPLAFAMASFFPRVKTML
jgi:hypothetical protein